MNKHLRKVAKSRMLEESKKRRMKKKEKKLKNFLTKEELKN